VREGRRPEVEQLVKSGILRKCEKVRRMVEDGEEER